MRIDKMKLTANQKKLAKLVTQCKGTVEILHGCASRPIKSDSETVFVGEHFWWGCLVPEGKDYDSVIAEWRDGKGQWYSSKGTGGRPRKAVSEVNPQVQIGRHPEDEIDAVDAAAKAAGKTRSDWAWEKLIVAARRDLLK